MLTPEIKNAIASAELIPLATSSLTGVPNVVPVKYVQVVADDLLWITDNYLCKTLANLRENPEAAFYVGSSDPKLWVQIKGTVEIHTEGESYERMKAAVRQNKPDLPAKSLVMFRVREIYQCLPGPTPGHRIWPPSE
jgi:predicted pyridoxine 5'-phosphate oxidase superfamily flavin-nucleotide-binding protein